MPPSCRLHCAYATALPEPRLPEASGSPSERFGLGDWAEHATPTFGAPPARVPGKKASGT
jgi:hypothetical protein